MRVKSGLVLGYMCCRTFSAALKVENKIELMKVLDTKLHPPDLIC